MPENTIPRKYPPEVLNDGPKRKSPIVVLLILGLFLVVLISGVSISIRDEGVQTIKHEKKMSGPILQTITYEKLSGPISNPLMGWAPWATLKETSQSHTLVYVDLTWREFEPQEGVFDFDAFEKQQQLARWRREGKRVVFRFVTDVPRSETHLDIPDWLFNIMGDNSGGYYDNDYGKGFSPDYSDPVFIKYHQLAIKALGERYGQDDFFAFIELGSLGHWGEWHEDSGIKQFPPENIRDLYVYDYVNAFKSTHLMMRRPFTIARELDLGLYNDMTGNLRATNSWLNWIRSGGDYLPNEKNTLVPMPDGWKSAPIGGEQASNMSDEQTYDTNLETTLQLLKESHTTFIGPGSPYKVEANGPLQAGIDQVLSTMGYRLYIDHVEMPLSVKFGREIQIKFSFSNDGIAPFYYEWPTRVYLYDESGKTISAYPMQMDLRKILPDQVYEMTFLLPVSSLGNGKYTIGFAIIDPLTSQPGVKLANENARADLIQEIGTFEVKRLFNLPNN